MTWADSVFMKMFLAKTASMIWAFVRVIGQSLRTKVQGPLSFGRFHTVMVIMSAEIKDVDGKQIVTVASTTLDEEEVMP